MTSLSVILYGLVCPACETEDELWHDTVRGVVECRACGDRNVVGEDDPGRPESYGFDLYDGGGWDRAYV
ncbi:hypothetical protein DQ384_37585 [Sphaerisporangium album]|uniref:Uncharacterized protein n=1 Tax=Sphaerisporangium album TaxID=509200 RepID=A0A367ER51_9ACTN|nr:hypothetical protein [Sphaerisporangium album]RCG20075.1 hypothetical protein DQ384_37585 [Sphaerisporangium album]